MVHSWEDKAREILAEQDTDKHAALINWLAGRNRGTADALRVLTDRVGRGMTGNQLVYELHCIMDNHARFPGVAWSIHDAAFADQESATDWAQHQLEATGADRVKLYVTGVVSASGNRTVTMHTEHELKGDPVVELIKR